MCGDLPGILGTVVKLSCTAGEVAERLKGKSGKLDTANRIEGSNPSLSATL